MEDLEANCNETPFIHGSEEEPNCTSNDANLDEEQQVQQRVHKFYFVKFFPCEDPTIKSEIEKTEKIIRSLDEIQSELYREIKEKKVHRDCVKSRLEFLMEEERSFRNRVAGQKEKLDPLKLAFDKLNFSNNAYRDIGIKSCVFGDEEEEVNFRNLHFRMIHGNNNLAAEKQLLKEISGSHERAAISSRLVEDLRLQILCHFSSRHCRCFDEDWHRENFENIKHLKLKREKAIANAAVKGKIWKSLGSKKAIQEEINLIEKESEELRKKQLAKRAEIKHIERKLQAIERDIHSLHNQNAAAYRRKDQAYKRIYLLRKQHEEMNSCYYGHLSVLKNAKKLAKKKDIAALQELRRKEIEKFMSKWSSSKDFRGGNLCEEFFGIS